MSDQVGNPEDWFSHNKAQLKDNVCQFSIEIYTVGAHLKCLVMAFLISTHNIGLYIEKKFRLIIIEDALYFFSA